MNMFLMRFGIPLVAIEPGCSVRCILQTIVKC